MDKRQVTGALALIESRKAQSEESSAAEALRRRRELHAEEKAKVLARLQETKQKEAARESVEAARAGAEKLKLRVQRQQEKMRVQERLQKLGVAASPAPSNPPRAAPSEELTFTLSRWDPHGLIFEPEAVAGQARPRTRVAAVSPESEVHSVLPSDAAAATVGMCAAVKT